MEDLLLDFISERIRTKERAELTRSTLLEKDLWLFGDEAAEFIHDYSQHFNVDVSGFDFPRYFTKESVFYFLYKIFPSLNSKKKELTIGHLLSGIEAGRLDEEVISASGY